MSTKYQIKLWVNTSLCLGVSFPAGSAVVTLVSTQANYSHWEADPNSGLLKLAVSANEKDPLLYMTYHGVSPADGMEIQIQPLSSITPIGQYTTVRLSTLGIRVTHSYHRT